MINRDYLRKNKAAYMKKWDDAPFPNKTINAYSYENATILPCRPNNKLLFGLGGVVDKDNNFIQLSEIKDRFSGKYDVDACEFFDETIVFCGFIVKHWGHFLIESITRLWYCLDNDNKDIKYIFVCKENEDFVLDGNYKKFFELLGILDQIVIINKPTKYAKVIIPEISYSRMNYYSDKYKNIFNAIASNVKTNSLNKYKKVYFSRSHLTKANHTEIGHDMLDSFFENNDFKLLYPEELELDEMIFYIRNAEICAMPSGSLPHNLLFAQDNKKVIVIERQMLINEIQVDIDRIKDLDITYIDANYLVYPATSGGGPFFHSYTRQFDKFVKDNNYRRIDNYYLSERYKKKCLRTFVKMHRKYYVYDWGLESWASELYGKEMYEAHEETVEDLYKYIKGKEPFMYSDYFKNINIKKIIKRMICK